MNNLFTSYWSQYKDKSLSDKQRYFYSLSKTKRKELLFDFYNSGWFELFVQNKIDGLIDHVKKKYDIDVIDMRIKAIKSNKVFLIPRTTWECIEDLFYEYEDIYNLDVLFGGIVVSTWGRQKQFCRIKHK